MILLTVQYWDKSKINKNYASIEVFASSSSISDIFSDFSGLFWTVSSLLSSCESSFSKFLSCSFSSSSSVRLSKTIGKTSSTWSNAICLRLWAAHSARFSLSCSPTFDVLVYFIHIITYCWENIIIVRVNRISQLMMSEKANAHKLRWGNYEF